MTGNNYYYFTSNGTVMGIEGAQSVVRSTARFAYTRLLFLKINN